MASSPRTVEPPNTWPGGPTLPGSRLAPDPDAVYARTVRIDVSDMEPFVAFPHLPQNVRPASEAKDRSVDQVVIGSCTNGRIEDLRLAARILRGRHVAKGVRCIVIPATARTYRQALEEGLFEVFLDAGAIISPPTCGPCLGGHMGILAKGERCVSTTNRNFVGRMGHRESEVYLASPATAAASAVAGQDRLPFGDPGGDQNGSGFDHGGAKMRFQGTAYVFGQNVNTDEIIPARYLTTTDPSALARHCMEDARPGFGTSVAPGGILVAGANFGCGSSREHAPIAIKAAGISCVVAESFARIFFRNAINIGLPIVECDGISRKVTEGDTIRVDLDAGRLTTASGEVVPISPFPPFMQRIIEEGGWMPYLLARPGGRIG